MAAFLPKGNGLVVCGGYLGQSRIKVASKKLNLVNKIKLEFDSAKSLKIDLQLSKIIQLEAKLRFPQFHSFGDIN